MRTTNIIVVLLVIALVSFCGCQQDESVNDDNRNEEISLEESMVHHVEAIGGSESEWRYPYSPLYYGIPGFIYDLADKDTVDEWRAQFASYENPNGRDRLENNVVNAVREIGISKEAFVKRNAGYPFTEEEIEAIFSGSQSMVNKVFVNRGAVLVDDEIYSLDWILAHTIEECRKEGITDDMLKQLHMRIENAPISTQVKMLKEKMDKAGIK